MKKAQPKKEEKPYKILEFLQKYYFIFIILFTAVICFNCFYHLGQFPARDWDEARHGVSAYEMLKNHNYILNTYAYEPDYWNLKPPLSFWGIIVGYKLFGYNLFGMRFYSALAFVLTALLTALFALKRYGKLESLAMTLFIACCSPFYRFHFARHGDADALFMLFVVISILSAILIKEHPRFLYLCGFAFSLAFLTKSWHAFLVVAVVGVYFITSKLIWKLNWKQWILFLLSAFGPIFLWMAIRYGYDGFNFFKNMVEVDLLHRVQQPLEGHTGGVFYYVQLMFDMSLTTGLLPLFIAVYYLFLKITGEQDAILQMNHNLKKDFSNYLIWILLPLVLFTIAQTKISWYAIPIFFPIVVLAGLLFAQIIQSGRKYIALQLLFCALLLIILIPSFIRTWDEIQPAYQDDLQIFMADELTKSGSIKGKNAYLEIDQPLTPLQWDQSYLLVGELYLDLKCRPGGVQEFIKHPQGSVLIISSNQYNQYRSDLQKYNVVEQNKKLLCLTEK